MSGLRRSATSRLEEGEAAWLAWSSATDDLADQARVGDPDFDQIELESNSDQRGSTSNGGVGDYTPIAMRGALPGLGHNIRHQADGYYALRSPPATEAPSIHGENDDDHELLACRSTFLEDTDGAGLDDFEPVRDLPSLPKLDFKPLILREWTLIIIAVFYLAVTSGIGVLYYFENEARIFHVHATASRFTIRYLPSLIGTLSTIIFQSVLQNFARLLPYIIMAAPMDARDDCATADETFLAPYFPFMGISHMFGHHHFHLVFMIVVQVYLNPWITPFKSSLILRKASEQDPDRWTVSISAPAAIYLMFNFALLFLIVMGMLWYLWGKRTGLKWDPVSLADQLVLLQGSDVLEDFSGLEYWSSSWIKSLQTEAVIYKNSRFKSLASKQYRLGYWRHKATNKYWHGVRKWPVANKESIGNKRDRGPPASSAFEVREQPHELSHDRNASTHRSSLGRSDSYVPTIRDSTPRATAWWKYHCREILEMPNNCYRYVYVLVSDFFAIVIYLIVLSSAGLGLWIIVTGRLRTGFRFPLNDFLAANLILRTVPSFWLQLIGGYWYQADLWYRQLQPYMGLRKPSPATENLLLTYPCDLPVVITLKALAAKHWRLAFISALPLAQKILPIVAGSVLTVDTTVSKEYFEILFSETAFKAVFGYLCAYLVLMPIVWPGPDRRLPIAPGCIADYIVLFYDSTLVRNDAFLPRRMTEGRWHMKYRLCLEERLYGFGIYRGRYGALHLGIDDVYGYEGDDKALRFVVPLKPPMRLYRRWLKSIAVWSSRKLHIKRQPTLHEEELEALHRLHTHLSDRAEEGAPAAREEVRGGDASM